MIQLNDVTYGIGVRELLQGVSWPIHPGRRAALVGPNGAGKTTLLRILAGEISDFSGSILKPNATRIGYLPQEETAVGEGAILPLVMAGHKDAAAIEQAIVNIHQALETAENPDPLLKKLGPLEEQFRQIGGYDLEARAKSILSGLGFNVDEFERSIAKFSGGWRMRVYLARLLVTEPDLLLLDEPTNHLDIESLEWLEQYLTSFSGSLVVVSHDRFFIDRLAHEIVELDRGQLTRYTGIYQDYERQKAESIVLQMKAYEEQQAEIERIQRFVDRFRYKATKAAQVQSRIKQLEKIERLAPPVQSAHIQFKLESEISSHKEVVALENMWFKYEQDWVLEDLDLKIFRGERVALVGVNGAGKTTLTRLITGEFKPQKGESRLGGRVSIGYYAQHQIDALNASATVLEEVMAASGYAELKIRKILGVFHFSGDDVFKRVGVLSGGEKARVSLAKMLARPANFLIMDEPTNHLDMASKQALEEAFQSYDGTLLMISHDRYFLDKLVTKVIELKDNHLRVFEGNYTDYMKCRAADEITAQAAASDQPVAAELSVDSQRKSKEQKRLEAQQRQIYSKERNQLLKLVKVFEDKIVLLEEEKNESERLLADPDTYNQGDKAAALQKTYRETVKALEEALTGWEEAQAAYESVLAKMNLFSE